MADLAGGMADDFNNILTTVMGACSLIDRNEPENQELRQCVAVIRSSAERAVLLSHKLLQASAAPQSDSALVVKKGASRRDKKQNDAIVSVGNFRGRSKQ